MEKKKRGRPTIFSKELGDIICDRIANGESLRSVCRDEAMPCRRTAQGWLLDDDKQDFLRQYKNAVDIRTENMFDELLEIADKNGEDVQRSRLRVDTRKWHLSKLMPKKYGDKVDVTSNGEALPAPILVKFLDGTEQND